VPGGRRAKKEWGLFHLNYLKNIFLVAPALTGITYNFIPKIAGIIEIYPSFGRKIKSIKK